MSADNGPLVADYQVLSSMNAGGDFTLYVATPPARLGIGQDKVLLKVVPGAGRPEALELAVRELRTFASVQSPYLVRLLDAGQDGDTIFYAMEYPPRGTLDQPAEPLTVDQRLWAVAAAARGAHALHEAGIVHRNITVGSVVLHEGGAKLANLGMAKPLVPGSSVSRFPDVDDIEYLDPRLLLGDGPSRATDIWSLGIVLHWAATGGRGVHPGSSDSDPFGAARRVLTEAPVVTADLPAPVAALIRQALAPDSSERPPTAEALAVQVEHLVQGDRVRDRDGE